MKQTAINFLFIFFTLQLKAQDTLPNFNAVKYKDGSVSLTWINDYGIVKQITIQRSTDSLKRFASIGTYPNPLSMKGIFADKKAKLVNYYYRIFVQLPEGKFFYTPSKKVISYLDIPIDTTQKEIDPIPGNINEPPVFKPSDFIYTDKKSNIIITLPDAEKRNYSIKFFSEEGKLLYHIPKLKESNLIVERYNFYKSGWYYFEIYLNNKLFEKNKFQLMNELPKTNR